MYTLIIKEEDVYPYNNPRWRCIPFKMKIIKEEDAYPSN